MPDAKKPKRRPSDRAPKAGKGAARPARRARNKAPARGAFGSLGEDRALRAILERVPSLVAEIDRSGTVLYINRTFSGAKPESAIGGLVFDFLPQSDHALVREKIDEAFQTRRAAVYEHRDVVIGNRTLVLAARIQPVEVDGDVPSATLILRDITEEARLHENIRKRIEIEQLLVAVSGEFINSPVEKINSVIAGTLRRVGEQTGIDSAGLFLFSEDRSLFFHTQIWTKEGFEGPRVRPKGLETSSLPWMMRKILNKETVVMDSREGLPPEAETERAWLRRMKVRSSLNAPVLCGGEVLGFVGFITMDSPGTRLFLPEDLLLALRAMGAIFGNAITRKRNEERSRGDQERCRNIVEQSLLGILVIQGDEPRVVFSNRAAAEMLGFTTDEIVGLPPGAILGISHPEEKERLLGIYRERLRGAEHPPSREVRIERRDGTHRWLHVYSTGTDYGGGPAVHLLCVDITSRKKAEQALQRSEEKYRLLAESAQDGIFVQRSDMRFEYVNPSLAAYLGRKQEDVIGKSLPELVSLDVALERERNTRSVLESGKTRRFRNVMALPTGTGVFETTLVPLQVTGEKASAVLGISRDVTEEERNKEELGRSEEKYRTLAESSLDLIFLIDPDLRVSYVNSAAARAVGLRPERVVGMRLDELFEGAYATPYKQALLSVLRTGEPVSEERLFSTGRATMWITTTLSPIRSKDGEVQAVLGVSRDITDRKEMEERTRRHGEELEIMVRERTEQVRSLERRQTEIEKLAATGRMAARVAHEINNPLAGIRNSFVLIRDAIPPDNPYARYVPIVLREIDTIAFIVSQMSKLHASDVGSPTRFPPARCIEEVATLLRRTCEKKGVRLELDFGEDRAAFTMTEHLLRQILYNLILNAIEASPAQGKVVVRARILDNGHLDLSIADEGPGIPEEIRPRIFEPLFTTKSVGQTGGLGLGLSIVKSIVEALNGSIELECTPGAETVFRVLVPPEKEGRETP
ncbi:MAG: PAS domain S-box protein [Candidatus Eisenbacteria bacterium]